jgi:hypothetical protein
VISPRKHIKKIKLPEFKSLFLKKQNIPYKGWRITGDINNLMRSHFREESHKFFASPSWRVKKNKIKSFSFLEGFI